jgi:hypothetical protein
MEKRNLILDMKLAVIIVGLASILIYSCAKSGGASYDPGNGNPHVYDPGDSTFPVIYIDLPVDSQVYHSGDLMKVEGRITDNGLYRGNIKIVNDVTGELVKQQLYETHGLQSFNFSVPYSTSVTNSTYYTVTVSYEDHGLNTSVKSVKAKVVP